MDAPATSKKTSGTTDPFLRIVPSSGTLRVPINSPVNASSLAGPAQAYVRVAESIVKEDWIRSQYEIVPKGAIAKLARDYKARLASRPYKKTSDIDLPMIDDEEDW